MEAYAEKHNHTSIPEERRDYISQRVKDTMGESTEIVGLMISGEPMDIRQTYGDLS